MKAHRRFVVTVLVGALVVAACSDGDGADDVATTTSTTSGPSPADALCDTLASADYETRKAALQEFRSGGETDVGCSDLVAAVDDALVVEERAAGLGAESVAAAVRCDDRTVFPSITNVTESPIGFAGTVLRRNQGDDSRDVRSPLVFWEIDPGATAATERDIPRFDFTGCGIDGSAFDADPSPADASVPGDIATDPQASDDPVEWFAAIVENEDVWVEAGDPNGVATTEDIRSREYQRLVREAPDGPGPTFERGTRHTVCATTEGPDAGYVGVAYRVERDEFSSTDDDGQSVDLPAEEDTYFGVFRRGTDGRWRWLIRSAFVQSSRCNINSDIFDRAQDTTSFSLPPGITPADVAGMTDAELRALIEEVTG